MLAALSSLFGGSRGKGSPASASSPSQAYPSSSLEDPSASYPPRENAGQPARVKQTLARIKALTRRMNPELLDTLEYPASARSIAELQAALREYLIPKDVLEAYACHDGQDSFSVPQTHTGDEAGPAGARAGFIYGLWWMTLEEVVAEYQFWRRLDISTPPSPVATRRTPTSANAKGKGRAGAGSKTHTAKAPSQDAFLFGSEMDPHTVRGRMASCPPGFVREEYSHPSWLPLLKDGYGNYIGIDLDPPSLSAGEIERLPLSAANGEKLLPGRGQVIAFGREVDTKTVLWNGWAETSSSSYDNLGGGGWARFLASYADDLSASSTLHSDARARANDNEYTAREEEEDDEGAYRASQGGRQEITSRSLARGAQGLEWMAEGGEAYEGLGAIEALVERSKRHWAAVGMYALDSEEGGGEGDETFTSSDADADASGVHGAYPDKLGAGIGIERQHQHRPTPLRFDSAATDATATPLASESALLSAGSGAASADADGFVDVPTTSTGMAPAPASPEPSLILSPPSPKDNSETFQPFPSGSPRTMQEQTASARSQQPSSPVPGGLASPSRMSPNQLARFSERERERERERTSSNTSTTPLMQQQQQQQQQQRGQGRRTSSQHHAPPPMAMPLGLPTLEFGNGIWEYGDTEVAEMTLPHGGAAGGAAWSPAVGDAKGPAAFEVVVDRR